MFGTKSLTLSSKAETNPLTILKQEFVKMVTHNKTDSLTTLDDI